MKHLHSAAHPCAVWAALCALSLVVGCGEESQEAARVSLPVEVGAMDAAPVVTDLGFEVEVQELKVAALDLEFTVEGEVHEAALGRAPWWRRAEGLLVGQAWAHPGHYAGGAVTGELPGRFVLGWTADEGEPLGEASLLAGAYTGANFTFGRGERGDGLAAGDPLLGHSALLRGEARKGGQSYPFVAVVDQDEARQVVGLPFVLEVGADTRAELALQFLPQDPTSSATVFDGIEFDALEPDAQGVVQLAPGGGEGYNRLRRALQTHSFYRVEAR